MKIRPIFDRVVLKPLENREQTRSGIFIPESAVEKPHMAVVVAVGDCMESDGKKVEMKVKVGDRVLYSKFAGIEYKIEKDDFLIIRQGDILAIVEKE